MCNSKLDCGHLFCKWGVYHGFDGNEPGLLFFYFFSLTLANIQHFFLNMAGFAGSTFLACFCPSLNSDGKPQAIAVNRILPESAHG